MVGREDVLGELRGERERASYFTYIIPLSPNSDENEISLYIINTCSKIQVMRITKVITKNDMSNRQILVP